MAMIDYGAIDKKGIWSYSARVDLKTVNKAFLKDAYDGSYEEIETS